MKWRGADGAPQLGSPKPSLGAVLDHYSVKFSPSKGRQMVQCVFHVDRTASMSVDLTQQVWNCHSCGEGGDAWTMLMRKEGLNFAGARDLAASLGLGDGDAGGGDGEVRGGYLGRRRPLPAGQRDRQNHGGYTPTWRRL